MGCGCVVHSVNADVLSAQQDPSRTERGVEGTKTHRAETSHHMATACSLGDSDMVDSAICGSLHVPNSQKKIIIIKFKPLLMDLHRFMILKCVLKE